MQGVCGIQNAARGRECVSSLCTPQIVAHAKCDDLSNAIPSVVIRPKICTCDPGSSAGVFAELLWGGAPSGAQLERDALPDGSRARRHHALRQGMEHRQTVSSVVCSCCTMTQMHESFVLWFHLLLCQASVRVYRHCVVLVARRPLTWI